MAQTTGGATKAKSDKVKKEDPDADERFINAHGVDLTAKVKKSGKGSIKVVRPAGVDKNGNPKDDKVDETRYDVQDLFLVGEGFDEGVEVVLNFDRLDGDSMNTRLSAQAHNGEFRFQMPMFGHDGKWKITAYVPQEDVKGKADEHQRVLQMVDQADLTITRHRV